MGLTQGQFAELAGVGLGAQNRYEAGATEPSASYFAHLANAGVDVVHLLTGRRAADSLDPETSAIVSLVIAMADDQRRGLLSFLSTIVPSATDTDRTREPGPTD
ncbi:hypothetical protein ASE59_02360 [Sphingomonas sp. Leaf10]|nr:hypothetical protein ASE59_02360 [Sphingomonas sp. Leaf10]